MDLILGPETSLPEDGTAGTLIARVWLPGPEAGPTAALLVGEDLHALAVATSSELMEYDNPAEHARACAGKRLGSISEILANTALGPRDPEIPHFLAPIDLQAIKAAGVTFMRSLLERVIEEQAKGDPSAAERVRQTLAREIGSDLASVRPGSEAAERLKRALIERGLWSQYLEVGIGPDAEIFTKAQPMSAIGTGAEIGLHPASIWNNPEPEVVLIANSRGGIVGATLGNDVNLRDFEGRSALLLGKSKDNNGSAAIGPFVRLFDAGFTLEDVRSTTVQLLVEGDDGFVLRGRSSMREISRDPAELVSQMMGAVHQYPDGVALYCGTMFAPTEDRGTRGEGFTHRLGDRVTIAAPKLGALVNRINRSDRIPPWRFGSMALMRNLARRGLLS